MSLLTNTPFAVVIFFFCYEGVFKQTLEPAGVGAAFCTPFVVAAGQSNQETSAQ